jgi:DNA-directed RNA polymerase subunit RPC12/RpoP
MKTSVVTCPKCGASLSPQPDERAVTCGYCETRVLVETGDASPAGAQPAGKSNPALVVAAAGVLVVLGVVGLVVLTRGAATPPPAPAATATVETASAPEPPKTAAPPAPSAPSASSASASPDASPPALADVTLEFGEKGTGPGQFEDARAITVDPGGLVYVAEYQSGRIQKFDSSGKYLDAIAMDAGKGGSIIPSIAATYDGHLWVSRSDDLVELALPEGKVVRTVRSQTPHLAYGAVAVDPTNAIYAQNFGATTWTSIDGHGPPRSDDVRKLDKNGVLLAAYRGIVSDFYFGGHIAVDREGTVYLAERLRRIDVIDPKGKVKARINAPGDGGIAVDGKGRIFLGSGSRIAVFEAGGAKIGDIPVPDVEDIAMGQDGRLYALGSRSRVHVLTLR